jgi:hypothetical protein
MISTAEILMYVRFDCIKNVKIKEKHFIYNKVKYCSKIILTNDKIMRYQLKCVYDNLKNINEINEINDSAIYKRRELSRPSLLDFIYTCDPDDILWKKLSFLNVPINDISYILICNDTVTIGYKYYYDRLYEYYETKHHNTIIANCIELGLDDIIATQTYLDVSGDQCKILINNYNIFYTKDNKNYLDVYRDRYKILINKYNIFYAKCNKHYISIHLGTHYRIKIGISSPIYDEILSILNETDRYLSIVINHHIYYIDYAYIYRIIVKKSGYTINILLNHKVKVVCDKKIYMQLIKNCKLNNTIIMKH